MDSSSEYDWGECAGDRPVEWPLRTCGGMDEAAADIPLREDLRAF